MPSIPHFQWLSDVVLGRLPDKVFRFIEEPDGPRGAV